MVSIACKCLSPSSISRQTSVPRHEGSYCACRQWSWVHPEQAEGRGRTQACRIWGNNMNICDTYNKPAGEKSQCVMMLVCRWFWVPSLLQSNCAQYAADRREEEKMCDHLISASKHRDHVTANQLKQKILNILTNKHGAWGTMSQRWGGDARHFLSNSALGNFYF